jgi:hypothetical protein
MVEGISYGGFYLYIYIFRLYNANEILLNNPHFYQYSDLVVAPNL